MKKRILSALLAVSVLAIFGSNQASAALIAGVDFPMESEPNGTKATANFLQPDGDASPLPNALGVTGGMSSSDTDWFTFHLDTSDYTSGVSLRLTYGTSQNTRNISWNLFDAADNPLGSLSGTINSSSPTRNITLTIANSGQYWVRATSSSSSSNYNFMVQGLNGAVVTVIPEPSTYALLGLGVGALVWLRRRQRG